MHQPKDVNPKTQYGLAKPAMRNVPLVPLLEMGRVMDNGASKYGQFNWSDDAVSYSTYSDAIFRHWALVGEGEDRDAYSGCLHLAHIMACAAILLDAQAGGMLVDDRNKAAASVADYIQGNTQTLHASDAAVLRDPPAFDPHVSPEPLDPDPDAEWRMQTTGPLPHSFHAGDPVEVLAGPYKGWKGVIRGRTAPDAEGCWPYFVEVDQGYHATVHGAHLRFAPRVHDAAMQVGVGTARESECDFSDDPDPAQGRDRDEAALIAKLEQAQQEVASLTAWVEQLENRLERNATPA